MLKNRMLVLLVAILGLAACSNKGNTSKSDEKSFFTNYEEYVYELKTDEIEELRDKIKQNFLQISYVDVETKVIGRGSLYENEENTTIKRENNEKVCYVKTITTSTSKTRGIQLTTQTKDETYYASVGKSVIRYSIYENNEKFLRILSSFDTFTEADNEVVLKVGYSTFNVEGFKWLKKQDGSIDIIYTNQNLLYEAVEWGNETKVLYTLKETLCKYMVNSDGVVTDYVGKSQTVTNRDATTGEWFSENTVVSSTETTYKYYYGSKIENANSTTVLNALRNNAFIADIVSATYVIRSSDSVWYSESINISSPKTIGFYNREASVSGHVYFYQNTYLEITINVKVAKLNSSNFLTTEQQAVSLKIKANQLEGNFSSFDSTFDGLKYIGSSYEYSLTINVKFKAVLYTDGVVKCEAISVN